MKICIITGEFPPMQGGVGDYTHELSHAYSQMGHQVTVITSVQGIGKPGDTNEFAIRPIVKDWTWSSCNRIVQAIKTSKPDVVNIQYQAAAYGMKLPIHLLPLRLRKEPCKVVTTYHDLRVPYLFPKAGPLRWQAVLALARWSDGIIVTNADDKSILSPYDFIHQIARIPIGSNIAPNPPADFNRDAWREHLGVKPGETLLAYFGFLNESKGGETLIRTVARLVFEEQPVKLLMVGGRVGSSDLSNLAYAERIDQLIDVLGISDHVISTGYIPEADVSANLLASDICVLPYRDGISLRRGTFMAAIAHGLPIVSTRYPVAKTHIPNSEERWHPAELKGGSNILLVPPEDDEVMADAITRLIASPRLRQHLGEEAKALSVLFRWPQIAQQTLELLRELGIPQDGQKA